MAEANVTSKWQMVLPRPIREHLKLNPGDRVDFLIRDNGEVVVRPASGDVRLLKGILHRPGRRAVSLRTMDRVIRRRAGRSL